MGMKDARMKIVVKLHDVVALAKRFETSPREAMQEVVAEVREALRYTLEQTMKAEIALFLGKESEIENKRNGYRTRAFGIKGVGVVQLSVPRDRAGRFQSKIVPAQRHYDEAIERDVALLHLAGISTRMLSYISLSVLGVRVSHEEVHRSLDAVLPGAKRFLERPLHGRRFLYLYVDGTNFHVRRTTVEKEPTLVVVGVDENGHKSVLSMRQGDRDNRRAWSMVFSDLKNRGLDVSAVQLGVMDGLPGLADAFIEAFGQARTARCWAHKSMNVFPRVPKRYQAGFQASWDAMQYAADGSAARDAFAVLKAQWRNTCGDAVDCIERDLESLLVHYDFPKAHWDALRTTNAIERVHKEFKRRTKAMESVGPDTLNVLLAFTALRLEFGWSRSPITSTAHHNLQHHRSREQHLQEITRTLLN
jgi:transposase-like protein